MRDRALHCLQPAGNCLGTQIFPLHSPWFNDLIFIPHQSASTKNRVGRKTKSLSCVFRNNKRRKKSAEPLIHLSFLSTHATLENEKTTSRLKSNKIFVQFIDQQQQQQRQSMLKIFINIFCPHERLHVYQSHVEQQSINNWTVNKKLFESGPFQSSCPSTAINQILCNFSMLAFFAHKRCSGAHCYRRPLCC